MGAPELLVAVGAALLAWRLVAGPRTESRRWRRERRRFARGGWRIVVLSGWWRILALLALAALVLAYVGDVDLAVEPVVPAGSTTTSAVQP